MGVEAVEGAINPVMFDHDVSAVAAVAARVARVNHGTRGDTAHEVQRGAVGIATKGANVDAFMEFRVNESRRSAFEISGESVFAALPGSRDHPFEVAVGVHVELPRFPREEGGVVGWKDEPERVRVGTEWFLGGEETDEYCEKQAESKASARTLGQHVQRTGGAVQSILAG